MVDKFDIIDLSDSQPELTDEMLSAYIDGTLTEEDARAVESLIGRDPELAEAMEIAGDASENYDALYALYEELGEDFYDFLYDELGLTEEVALEEYDDVDPTDVVEDIPAEDLAEDDDNDAEDDADPLAGIDEEIVDPLDRIFDDSDHMFPLDENTEVADLF